MWQGIVGHDAVAECFRATLRRGRLASTYLFVGPSGIGKRRFALALAKALLCQQTGDDPLEPCGQCESCRLFESGNHPDLETVRLPPDKAELPIKLFIGEGEQRNREGLCHRIALKPFMGGRKVAIIDDADHFNQESANCLLKLLEEPPPRSLVILIGTSPSRQLPTIRSRAQIVRFQPLQPETVVEILVQTGAVTDREQAARLAAYSEGSVERARALADPALWRFREHLLNDLSAGTPDSVRLARSMQGFVDEAGKEPSARRDRLRTVAVFVEEFFRGLLRTRVGGAASGDQLLQVAVQRFAARNCADSAHSVTESLDGCLETLEQIDRNANLSLVIQNWCEGLALSVR